MKTIVITGASSGIGKAAAIKFANEGYNVAATMRSPEKETELTSHKNIKIFKLDVSKAESIKSAFQEISRSYDSIDVLLNNAGYSLDGPFEISSEAQIRDAFEVNVFGVIMGTHTFLPKLRESKGILINVSSVGGRVCYPMHSIYHSTKFAIEGFTEGLFAELAPFGVKVKLIEPGAIATDLMGRSRKVAEGLETPDNPYAELFENMQKALNDSSTGFTLGSAEGCADVIFQAATDGTNTLRYLVGDDAKQIVEVKKNMGDEAYLEVLAKKFGLI